MAVPEPASTSGGAGRSGDRGVELVYGTKANVPEYMFKGGNTYRIITDHLGSVRVVVDVNTGTIAQRIDYDTWGVVQNDTSPGFQPFGLPAALRPGYGIGAIWKARLRCGYGKVDGERPVALPRWDSNLYGYLVEIQSTVLIRLDMTAPQTALQHSDSGHLLRYLAAIQEFDRTASDL